MSGRVRVWCLRHGESENVTASVAGSVPNAPLTERGHRQAGLAAQALAAEPRSRQMTVEHVDVAGNGRTPLPATRLTPVQL
jgi:alpha-ribazole phosphatase/probable phosphoglycerate mutase